MSLLTLQSSDITVHDEYLQVFVKSIQGGQQGIHLPRQGALLALMPLFVVFLCALVLREIFQLTYLGLLGL